MQHEPFIPEIRELHLFFERFNNTLQVQSSTTDRYGGTGARAVVLVSGSRRRRRPPAPRGQPEDGTRGADRELGGDCGSGILVLLVYSAEDVEHLGLGQAAPEHSIGVSVYLPERLARNLWNHADHDVGADPDMVPKTNLQAPCDSVHWVLQSVFRMGLSAGIVHRVVILFDQRVSDVAVLFRRFKSLPWIDVRDSRR